MNISYQNIGEILCFDTKFVGCICFPRLIFLSTVSITLKSIGRPTYFETKKYACIWLPVFAFYSISLYKLNDTNKYLPLFINFHSEWKGIIKEIFCWKWKFDTTWFHVLIFYLKFLLHKKKICWHIKFLHCYIVMNEIISSIKWRCQCYFIRIHYVGRYWWCLSNSNPSNVKKVYWAHI